MARIDDIYQMTALGHLEQFEDVYKFGRNDSVGATETIIAGGGVYGLPLAAQTVSVTSDDVNDAFPVGTGARTVHIYGLDADYLEIDEVVEMDGTSIGEYIRVFRAIVTTAGNTDPTGGANAGTITITQSVSATDMVLIAPNDGQTLCACYTVPANATALIWSADTTVGEGKTSTNRLKVRPFNSDQPFQTKGIRDNFENSVGITYKIPRTIPAKADIVFTAVSTAAGTAVTGTVLMQIFKPRG